MPVLRQPISIKKQFDEDGAVGGHPIQLVGSSNDIKMNDPNRTVVYPVAIPSTEADVWDPAGASTTYYDVEFFLVNIDGSNDATVDIGVDEDGNGGGTPDYYIAKSVPVRAGEVGVLLPPVRIRADDHVTGNANAASDVIMWIRIIAEGTAAN